jgi:hypothetical protein
VICHAGAQRLLPLGLGDDRDRAGYDQALDPWMSSLWDAALQRMPLPPGIALDMTDTLPPSHYLVTPLQLSMPAVAGVSSGVIQYSTTKEGGAVIPSALLPSCRVYVSSYCYMFSVLHCYTCVRRKMVVRQYLALGIHSCRALCETRG